MFRLLILLGVLVTSAAHSETRRFYDTTGRPAGRADTRQRPHTVLRSDRAPGR